jgi:Fic family protein
MESIDVALIEIHELRARFHELASGKDSLLRVMAEAEVPEQVYDSNAIENSTLSLDETEKILRKIDLDRFISEREMFEARNLARVVEYIHTKAIESELDLDVMLLLHKMLISNIRDDIAGRFRTDNEWVRVGSHIAPDPKEVVPRLTKMLVDLRGQIGAGIIRRVARLHLAFENIHPFVDGNGRIGRVLNNFVLIREGYVPINIKFIDRDKYYDALHEFDSKQTTKRMEKIVELALKNSYHKRITYLEGGEIIRLVDYAKKYRKSHSNLINKAHRQTIPAFLERGVWKIGDKKI